jgi:hypothetical protein
VSDGKYTFSTSSLIFSGFVPPESSGGSDLIISLASCDLFLGGSGI